MADSEILRHSDFAEEGAIRDHLQAELREFVSYLPVVSASFKEMANNVESSLKTIDGSMKDIGSKNIDTSTLEKFNAETKKATELSILKQKQIRSEAQANAELAKLRKLEVAEQRAKILLDEKEEKQQRKNASAYQQLQAELTKYRQISKDLQATIALGNKLTDEQARILTEATLKTQQLDSQIKSIDYSLGQAQRNVGNYNSELGILGKSIKGFGALGKILANAVGIDPEVFMGIKEVGMALKDVKHITEAEELAKHGENAAHVENTVSVEAETVAYEENAAAGALSTAGAIGIAAGIVAAGIAIVAYVSHLREEKEIEEGLKKIQERRLELFYETAKLTSKNIKERYLLSIDEKVALGKITDEDGQKRKADLEYIAKQNENRSEEKRQIEDLAKTYKLYYNAKGEVERNPNITTKKFFEKEVITVPDEAANKAYIERLKLFDDQVRITKEQIAKRDYQDKSEYNNAVEKIRVDGEKKEQDDTEESLKRLEEIRVKANDDRLKDEKETNEEKEKLNYFFASREIDLINATEKQKYAARLAVKKLYDEKIKNAHQKDLDDQFKKSSDEAKKLSDENSKQAEKDFKIMSALLAERQSAELLQLEKDFNAKKDFSVDAERKKQQAVIDIKIKYLEIEKKRNADNAEELSKIQTKINELNTDGLNSDDAALIKSKEEANKRLKKLEEDITKGIEDGLKQRSELQQQYDQKDIDFRKRSIDIQSKLAASGKDNVLAEEQASLIKAEERKIQDAKKSEQIQKNITLVKTFAETFQAALEKSPKGNFLKAFGEATAATDIVSNVFSKLFAGGFAEGVESLNGIGTETSDSNIAALSTGESVITAKGTKDNPGLATAMNRGTVDDYFESIYVKPFKAANVSTTSQEGFYHDKKTAEIFRDEIRALRDEIRSKPVQSISLGRIGEWVEESENNGIKIIKNYKKNTTRPSLRLNG